MGGVLLAGERDRREDARSTEDEGRREQRQTDTHTGTHAWDTCPQALTHIYSRRQASALLTSARGRKLSSKCLHPGIRLKRCSHDHSTSSVPCPPSLSQGVGGPGLQPNTMCSSQTTTRCVCAKHPKAPGPHRTHRVLSPPFFLYKHLISLASLTTAMCRMQRETQVSVHVCLYAGEQLKLPVNYTHGTVQHTWQTAHPPPMTPAAAGGSAPAQCHQCLHRCADLLLCPTCAGAATVLHRALRVRCRIL